MSEERASRETVFPSIPALFQTRMVERAGRTLVYSKVGGGWRGYSAQDLKRTVRAWASGLASLGIVKNDRVGILSNTRLDWMHADLAILHRGAVTVGVYPTLLSDDVAYQLEHSGARVVFVENRDQLAKVEAARARLSALFRAIVFQPEGVSSKDGFAITLEDLEAQGRAYDEKNPSAFDESWKALGPDDTATIIYTSGTTGPPKGAVLTHGNLTSVCAATVTAMPPPHPDELGIAFLPMAHALQRVACYCGINSGVRGAYAQSVEKFMDDVRELRPTVQASVPRLWEKLHAKIQAGLPQASWSRRKLFEWCLAQGYASAPYRKKNAPLPRVLALKWSLARKFFRGVVLPKLGFERIRFLSSGGAPIGIELLEFFYALDVLIIEGWGLTETAAPATFNRPDDFRFGTVGKPLPGVEVKCADDGELLVRGAIVFRGYYKDEEATRAAFDPDGFFRTGDIGEIDADGFVRITDRKKNLIVTSLGKKIAPQNLENVFKECPYLGPCLIHGDRRKFLTAIFTLDPEEIVPWARERGLLNGSPASPETLARDLEKLAVNEDVKRLVASVVEEKNQRLAGYEQIKRWRVVGDRWTIENGALTPTLKVKRKVLEERYRALLDGFYASEEGP
jgi:long-chain acyl-CoA synthetase